MTANAFVWSYIAMPHTPQEHAVAVRVSRLSPAAFPFMAFALPCFPFLVSSPSKLSALQTGTCTNQQPVANFRCCDYGPQAPHHSADSFFPPILAHLISARCTPQQCVLFVSDPSRVCAMLPCFLCCTTDTKHPMLADTASTPLQPTTAQTAF